MLIPVASLHELIVCFHPSRITPASICCPTALNYTFSFPFISIFTCHSSSTCQSHTQPSTETRTQTGPNTDLFTYSCEQLPSTWSAPRTWEGSGHFYLSDLSKRCNSLQSSQVCVYKPAGGSWYNSPRSCINPNHFCRLSLHTIFMCLSLISKVIQEWYNKIIM